MFRFTVVLFSCMRPHCTFYLEFSVWIFRPFHVHGSQVLPSFSILSCRNFSWKSLFFASFDSHDLVDFAIFLETTDSSSIIFQMGTWDWGSCFICPSFAVSYRDHWREDSMNFSHPKKQVNFGPANNANFSKATPWHRCPRSWGERGKAEKSDFPLRED